MKTKSKHIFINATSEKVFAYVDNLSNTGIHMTESSSMMMGSKLQLEQLSENAIGPDAKFRWFGKMMGFTLDFTVVVTNWIKNREKIWETVGDAKMIIMKWYRMYLVISPEGKNTKVELSITYLKPENIFFKIIALLLGPLYANWCLNNMLDDSKKSLEKKTFQVAKGGVQS